MARTLLVVDDSATLRNIIKIYVMSEKFDVLEASDGERALQLLRLVPVTLVVADINMPGMDGITFVQRVRASDQPALKSLPVILLTGDRSEDLRVRGQEAGANDFIYKPVTPKALVEAINKLVPPA